MTTHSSRAALVLPILFGVLTLGLVAWGILHMQGQDEQQASRTPATDTATEKQPEGPAPTDGVIEAPVVPPTEGRFADVIAASGIERDLAAEKDVLETMLEYFELLDWRSDQSKALNYKANRAEFEEYLASLPPEMVPFLLEFLEKEEDFSKRYMVLEALGEIGTDLAADGLVTHLDYMYEIDNSSEIRRVSLALGRVDSDHSFDLLNDLIDRDETEVAAINRYRFVEQLGDHSRAPEATGLFLDLVETDGNPKMRDAAASALKAAKQWNTAPDIERNVKLENSPYVKQTLIGALADIGDRNSLRTLAEIARTDENDSSRASAVEAIYRIGGPEAAGLLEDIAKTETDDRVKKRAIRRAEKLKSGEN